MSRFMGSGPPRSRRCHAFVMAGMLSAACCATAELLITPTAWTRLGYNDNRRLRDPDGPDILESTTEVTLANELQRALYSVFVAPRVRVIRRTEESELDTEDYFVKAGGERLFERQRVNLEFDFESEGTATTELTDSGLFDVNVKRTTLAANTGWAYSLTEILSVNLFGGYSDVAYEELDRSVFFDYDEANVGTGFRYVMSPTTTLLGNASISRFRTPAVRSETKSYSFRFGFEHRFTETVDASFMVGQNISRISVREPVTEIVSFVPLTFATRMVNNEESESGHLVNAFINKRFRNADMSVTWDRYFSPSSLGGRQRRQEVRSRGRYRLSERWNLDGEIGYRESEQEGSINTLVRALDFLTGTASLKYRLTKFWSAEVAYRYRSQQEESADLDAMSNEVFFGIRYEGDPFAYNF